MSVVTNKVDSSVNWSFSEFIWQAILFPRISLARTFGTNTDNLCQQGDNRTSNVLNLVWSLVNLGFMATTFWIQIGFSKSGILNCIDKIYVITHNKLPLRPSSMGKR